MSAEFADHLARQRANRMTPERKKLRSFIQLSLTAKLVKMLSWPLTTTDTCHFTCSLEMHC